MSKQSGSTDSGTVTAGEPGPARRDARGDGAPQGAEREPAGGLGRRRFLGFVLGGTTLMAAAD
ncbi:MAG: hypothetical protein L0H93_20350, partial [Nocardioides sp.]|nr:hypothetical protein [Nocardioides sp.]